MAKKLNIAPLSAGFTLSSILGFIISLMYVYPKSATWGFTLTLFFVLMFISAMISLTYSQELPKY